MLLFFIILDSGDYICCGLRINMFNLVSGVLLVIETAVDIRSSPEVVLQRSHTRFAAWGRKFNLRVRVHLHARTTLFVAHQFEVDFGLVYVAWRFVSQHILFQVRRFAFAVKCKFGFRGWSCTWLFGCGIVISFGSFKRRLLACHPFRLSPSCDGI